MQNKEDQTRPAASQHQSSFAGSFYVWLKNPRVIWIIIASAAFMGFGVLTWHSNQKYVVEIVRPFESTKPEADEPNYAKGSRHLDIEAVRRTELEYRVNAGIEILEKQRREREDRLKKQHKKQADYIVSPPVRTDFLLM